MNISSVANPLSDRDLPISEALISLIKKQVEAHVTNVNRYQGVTINFKDPSYSIEKGGYHPVEIRLEQVGDEWHFDYITDFCFDGSPYAELVKDIDWNVKEKQCYTMLSGWLSPSDSYELFELWQDNFISYAEMEVFDITVTTDA
ncbi:DUF2787 domain-containing protein [Vibrio vulnificus]|uniref:DUF2787 domain-containing protein n=1 Tax=Vibrio vulnificus TaxID=672 RepID=UPI0005FAA93B|nr:DUF2787 domain-containing protein [Vibrio vulnificus]